ncbi:hypothetical protein B0H14DRAFT_2589912 [Mycena olivaceomarginata]|nr:hypothetical protein B0H14DRAFT_2589912 [Mycena olivaceomarginata]
MGPTTVSHFIAINPIGFSLGLRGKVLRRTHAAGLPKWNSQLSPVLCTYSLPHTIYLLHQFAFYMLSKDYYALIQLYQFTISGAKIKVQRKVEVSVFAFGPHADTKIRPRTPYS